MGSCPIGSGILGDLVAKKRRNAAGMRLEQGSAGTVPWHGAARRGGQRCSPHPCASRAKGTPRPSLPYLGQLGGLLGRSGAGAARPPFITVLSCTRWGDAAGERPGPTHVASFPLITTHRCPPAPSAQPRALAAERGRSIRVDGPAPPAPAPGHTPPSLAGTSILGSRPRPGGLPAAEGLRVTLPKDKPWLALGGCAPHPLLLHPVTMPWVWGSC